MQRNEFLNKPSKDHTLLEQYLLQPDLDEKDVLTVIAEMLLAGIETSSYTMGFLLYHLAQNPKAQSNLHGQAKDLRITDLKEALNKFELGKCSIKVLEQFLHTKLRAGIN